MNNLHYFNPGHEAAVVTRSSYYTPPANVKRMAAELAAIPAWYADEGDYYLVEEWDSSGFFSRFPSQLRPWATPVTPALLLQGRNLPPQLRAQPWGVSPQSIFLFNELAQTSAVSLHVPSWNERIVSLTGRQTAARCLERMHELLPRLALPCPACFCGSVQEAEEVLNRLGGHCVMKLPYSSSGRGLRWVRAGEMTVKDWEWIEGGLRRQGAVSVERALDRKYDCALEFYCDGCGGVRYEGFSCFSTSPKGAYQGNLLNAARSVEEKFARRLPAGEYDRIKEAVTRVVAEVFASEYEGFLGVDMLFYGNDESRLKLYPFVEVNLRRTFGWVAERISQRIIAPNATGSLSVVHNSRHEVLFHQSLEMSRVYPIEMEADRMRSGYLPLCPVTPDSTYAAYLLVT